MLVQRLSLCCNHHRSVCSAAAASGAGGTGSRTPPPPPRWKGDDHMSSPLPGCSRTRGRHRPRSGKVDTRSVAVTRGDRATADFRQPLPGHCGSQVSGLWLTCLRAVAHRAPGCGPQVSGLWLTGLRATVAHRSPGHCGSQVSGPLWLTGLRAVAHRAPVSGLWLTGLPSPGCGPQVSGLWLTGLPSPGCGSQVSGLWLTCWQTCQVSKASSETNSRLTAAVVLFSVIPLQPWTGSVAPIPFPSSSAVMFCF